MWNGQVAVPAGNQDSLYKSEKITLTFTNPGETTMQSFAGYYEIKVSGSDQLRIGTVPNSWTASAYVGSYSADTLYTAAEQAQDETHVAGTIKTAGTKVSIGYLHVKTDGSFEYYAAGSHQGASTATGLEFIFSVSPKESAGAETYNEATVYGTIHVDIGAVAANLPA